MKNIEIILFSKDRAAQSLACLESLKKHFVDYDEARITVLYKASDVSFSNGYKIAVQKTDKTITWLPENSFETQVKTLVGSTDAPYVMFLVDDIVFIENWSLKDQQFLALNNNSILAASLRLHQGITACYATGEDTSPPKLVKGMAWDWKNGQGDWGYPMSVDGNVYKTAVIKQILNHINFANPNVFEAALDSVKTSTGLPTMLVCYPENARLINIPANRVQNQFKNKFANGLTAQDINELFLQGHEIDFSIFTNKKHNTCHVPAEILFKEVK